MSQLNADLEATLVSDRLNPAVNGLGDDVHLLNANSEQSGEGTTETPVATIGESSLVFNFLALLIPVSKILASVFVLVTSSYSCIGVKQIWLLLMMAHDSLFSYVINLRIKNIVANARLNALSSQGPEQNPTINNDSNQGIQLTAVQHDETNTEQRRDSNDIEDPRPQSQITAANIQSNIIAERKAAIAKLTTLCTYAWVFLFFFWLERNAITEPTGCDSVEIDGLISIYVFIGWLWLLNPLLICFGGCIFIPIIIIFVCLFRKKNQRSASKKDLKKLVIKEYNSEIPGNKECAICIVDYQEGDKIVQLECSDMHHFHEECAKSWLKINGLCPICRTRLGEKKPNTTTATVDA